MAFQFYVSIEGQKQGKFKGETAQKAWAGKIAGVRYFSGATSPRDPATGQATGKRSFEPIKFTKQWDAASPQLFQALVTNEVLTSVLFEFVRTDPNGKEVVHFRVKLANASVASLHAYLDLTDRSGDPYDAHELEDVELTFQSIELEDVAGKTSGGDNWKEPVHPLPVPPVLPVVPA